MPKKKITHPDAILVVGARQNNLKNLNLEIPLNRITVVTGVSGSGKSSLAFDTLYAEGQRRYVETFSPYARQFMDRMDRPQVERIDNIPPAIAIDRKDPVRTSRSTVGTMTELTDYVKLLYARLGQLYCKKCGKPVIAESPEHVWKRLNDVAEGSEVVITFPVSTKDVPPDQLRKVWGRVGFGRFYDSGQIRDLDDWQPGEKKEFLHMVADRSVLRRSDKKRLMDSIELAFRFGEGGLDIWIKSSQHLSFSNRLECASCGISYMTPMPNLFSFNSPVGACPTCRGFGRTIDIDLDLVIPNPALSLKEGAIKPWGNRDDQRMEFRDLMSFCRRKKIPVDIPFGRLSKSDKKAVIDGTDDYYGVRGFFKWLETKTYKMPVRVFLSRYRNFSLCTACGGTRFQEETLLYRIGGLNIGEIYAMTVHDAGEFFKTLQVPAVDKASRLVLSEVRNRIKYLEDVGLGYLTLDRQSRTLSGGEVQRVALTSALGSSLVNTLYVLDEPSIGLHPRDNHRLIRILKGLRDLNNTVVVVEHDPDIIGRSDFMLDLGPRAGEQGGEVMYFGPTHKVNGSLTGQYMTGKKTIPVPEKRRVPRHGRWLTIKGAAEHNLKNVEVRIPLGCFVCLTGVSGSGKSTLVEDILYRGLKRELGDSQGRPGLYRRMEGLKDIDDVFLVDQRPIGRTPRANPLTYTKAMDPVRKLLADTDAARSRHLGAGHFSFNVAGGRCETCKGTGFERVEMQFLSDVYITCPDCNGRRFQDKVLEVTYEGKNIHDILKLTIDQAMLFFKEQPKVTQPLEPLVQVGLGYMRLGQPINTLSGGEAQRLKLSQYLMTGHKGSGLFIFDEPTTGLHFDDIRTFLTALQGLVSKGNTILVVEHNMDVIKSADWVIDLGPEGGEEGGRVVATGPPETLAKARGSHTGRFLKSVFSRTRRLTRPKGNSASIRQTASNNARSISIRGARAHNLRNISLTIPRQQLVVVTGVSGSGKSTLIFDIPFAEGQRRYLESLAPYVRQYVKILERPEVDSVSGLSPTVAIQQRFSQAGRRSTVATLTEIYHFLRLLYSKLGTQHCPGCGRMLTSRSREEIIAQIKTRYARKNAVILAPKVAGRKGFHKDILNRAFLKGYREARIDGSFKSLSKDMSLSRYHEHTIDLVVGRSPARALHETISEALTEGNGSLIIVAGNREEEIFSQRGICPSCGIGLQALDPRLFSFNSKQGACPRCDGLGSIDHGRKQGEPVAVVLSPVVTHGATGWAPSITAEDRVSRVPAAAGVD